MTIDKQNGNVATDKLDSNNDSIKHASEATNIKHCNISNTIHGKQKTAGGFIWKI